MGKPRRKYTEEFKRDAVRMMRNRGTQTVAALAIVVGACSSSSSGVTPGAACVAAGGQCLGDVNVQCEKYGSQDCGLGGLCCFDVVYDAATEVGTDAATFACASPQDCSIHLTAGPAVFCCIHNVCIVGQAAEALTCSDPAAQNIMASSYDQSCQTDSDCIAVEEGNFCAAGADNGCTNAAINKSAFPQYNADLAKTQASVCRGLSGCLAESGPCCQSGICQLNGQCGFIVQGDAATDSGADVGTSDAPAGD